MKKVSNIVLTVVLLLLVVAGWLCAMVQTTTLASYHNWFTAGELFAWMTANPYESSDIVAYCLRNVWQYWLLCSIVYIAVGVFVVWLLRKGQCKHIVGSILLTLLALVPMALPNLSHCLLRESHCAWQHVRAIKVHQNDDSDYQYNAAKADTLTEQEIYVLAIGESVRYQNWALNGEYCRQTTPRLQEQSNLVLYSDYYANATLTQYALPMMLTGTPPESFAAHFQRKTVAAAFAETGFRTALVSHRAQLMNNGWHDYLACDFDTIVWVEHDSLIAPALQQLTATDDNWFVLTHYLGNHMFYTNCPDDCLQWRPDYNADSRAKSDSLFLNAYDNSLLYTDRMLSEAIRILEQTHAVSAWLFVSDHGEYIDKRVSGHGYTYHPTKEEYYVPLMVWYSNAYKDAYPRKVSNMVQHKDMPLSADCVWGSLLDMANIRVKEDVQSSIFADSVEWSKRTLLLPDGETVMEL